jgi:hypothetical protein
MKRAEERAPLTAAASGQVMHLSGAKKTKKICLGQKTTKNGRLHKFPTLPLQLKPYPSNSSEFVLSYAQKTP